MTHTLISLDEIAAAAARIEGVARRTPLIPAALPGLFLKCENMQPMGAFKVRGACNMVAQLAPAARARGVLTYSSGNHGQAVALAAQLHGVPAVIVMPETAPAVKVKAVIGCGAEVVFAGRTSSDRRAKAEAIAAERGLAMVPPFDHEWIIAGQGTAGLEILEQCPDVAEVYVPVGGGGLIAGVSTAIRRSRPGVRVVGVEPAGAAKMSTSLRAGEPVTLEQTASIADGLLTLRPGDLTFAHVRAFVDDVITVTEEEIASAVHWLFRTAKIVAEPSGAAATAGVLARGEAAGATVAIVSGGNVAPEDFARYIAAKAAFGPGEDLRCSFCLKSQNDVAKLIAGPDVFICDDCVEVCRDIIADDAKTAAEPPQAPPQAPVMPTRPQSPCALCARRIDPSEALAVPDRGLLCSQCVESIGRAVLGRTDSR